MKILVTERQHKVILEYSSGGDIIDTIIKKLFGNSLLDASSILSAAEKKLIYKNLSGSKLLDELSSLKNKFTDVDSFILNLKSSQNFRTSIFRFLEKNPEIFPNLETKILEELEKKDIIKSFIKSIRIGDSQLISKTKNLLLTTTTIDEKYLNKLIKKYKPTKLEQEVLQGIEQNKELIQNEIKNLTKKFKSDIESGKATKIPAGGSKNIGIYSYGDYIIKRVKPNRKISQETIDVLSQRISDMERVITPKSLVNLSDGTQGIIMNKATGTSAENLTDDIINKIPQEHWDNLLKDVQELSKRGIQTDLTKRSNFFYDPKKGFQLLDIEGASLGGESTMKFFEKGGETFYYPYEKYTFFPKKFISAKDMFLKIPKN